MVSVFICKHNEIVNSFWVISFGDLNQSVYDFMKCHTILDLMPQEK